MSDKVIAIEEEDGPFQIIFRRIMRMVPERDKDDKKLQRLIAFRLKTDGEGPAAVWIRDALESAPNDQQSRAVPSGNGRASHTTPVLQPAGGNMPRWNGCIP